MKQIALLHTVPSVLLSFAGRIRIALPGGDLDIHNTLDELLVSDANMRGFTRNNRNRLFHLLKAIKLEKPDATAVAYSTLTPEVVHIRLFLSASLITIDDAMMKKAIILGSKVIMMVTAQGIMGPTCQKLLEEAAKIDRKVELFHMMRHNAYEAIKQMNQSAHNMILCKTVEGTHGQGAVALARAPMAHMEKGLAAICGVLVLSSPALCVKQIVHTLYLLQ